MKKKPFKLSQDELKKFNDLYEDRFATETSIVENANAIWKELGQKHGFVWNSVEHDPNDENGYLVEPLSKNDFAEVHAETIPTAPTPEPEHVQDYPVTKEDVFPSVNPPTTVVDKNQLTVYIANSGIEKVDQEKLTALFLPFFDQAQGWMAIAKTLVVTSVDQVADMKKADNARLALKQIRGAIERTRKLTKEYSIDFGRAVDGTASKLTGAIQPIEDYLYDQAKFGEIQELKRKQQLADDRLVELQEYGFVYSTGFNLGEMDEDMYISLRDGLKQTYLNKKEQERQDQEAEHKRIADGQARVIRIQERTEKMFTVIAFLPGIRQGDYEDMTDEDFENLYQEGLQAKKDNELLIAQAKQEAENERKEILRKDAHSRRLIKLGLVTDGEIFYYKQSTVPLKRGFVELVGLPDKEFDEVFPEIEQIVTDFKADVDELEKQRLVLQQRRSNRIAVLIGGHYVKIGDDYAYRDKKGFNLVIVRESQIENYTEEQWNDLMKDNQDKIDAKKVEETPPPIPPSVTPEPVEQPLPLPITKAQKDVPLKTDEASRLVNYVHLLNGVELPLMTTKVGKEFIIEVRTKLDEIVTFIENRLL